MADDSKIQFDVELNEQSIDKSFDSIDKRAEKSAKESAAVFGEAFQRQEQELKDSIDTIVKHTKETASKSAKESASVFAAEFKKQDAIYSASVKQNIDNAIRSITGDDRLKKSAQESASVFEEAFAKQQFNLPDLTQFAAGWYLVKEAIDVATRAAKALVETLIEGEKSIRLENRFDAMAKSAGIASDVIKNKLGESVRGLVDDSDLLQLGTEAFIRLGEGAQRLPEVLSLAQKSYKIFGIDVVEGARRITEATESGNSKMLRELGIRVDLNAAVEAYALKLGTQSKFLSESQKEQARLSAILEEGNRKFKQGTTDADGLTEAIKRLGVAISNASEEASKGFSRSSISKWITDFVQEMADGVDIMTTTFKDRSTDTIEGLQNNTKLLNYQVAEFKRLAKEGATEATRFWAAQQAENATKKVEEYNAKLKEMMKIQQDAAKSSGGGPEPKSSEQIAAELQARKNYADKIIELNNQRRQSEVALAQDAFNREKNQTNLEQLNYQQKLAAQEQFEQQKLQLEKFYADNNVTDQAARQAGEDALELAHVNKLLLIRADYLEKKKQIEDRSTEQMYTNAQAFQDITKGMEEQARDLRINASKNFQQLGKQMFNTMGTASANAFAAFGAAIANGEDALQAFGKSLLNSLGQMAIQMGASFILQGTAYSLAGLANGPALIAAGAALAAFGGFLSASNGAGPRDVGGGGTAGGINSGIAGDTTSPIADNLKPEDTVAQTPKTEVNLTINGNVLDRRQAGLEIAQILEEQFSEQGLVIRGA